MSSPADASPAPLEVLPWDTGHFGLAIGRVASTRPTEPQLEAAVLDARGRGLRCVYFLCDADALEAAAAAGRLGFAAVDLRVTLGRTVAPGTPDPRVRDAVAADRAFVGSLAEESFRVSRFFVDGRFPEDRVRALYDRWVERDLADPRGVVLVGEHDGRPAGFASGGVGDGGAGSVSLVAVADGFRGAGVGRRLVGALLDRLARGGAERVTVVTQGRNVGAIRLYEEEGFRMKSIQTWYHAWLR